MARKHESIGTGNAYGSTAQGEVDPWSLPATSATSWDAAPTTTASTWDSSFAAQGTVAGGWDNPFGAQPSSYAAPEDPFKRGVPMSPDVYGYMAQGPAVANVDPFAYGTSSPQIEAVNHAGHELGDRVRDKLRKIGGAIVNCSGIIAKGGDIARRFVPGSKLDKGLAVANGYMDTGFSVAAGAQNTHNVLQNAYSNREQIAQGALDYGKRAGIRVAGEGARAAMDVIAKRTGVSVETGNNNERQLKVRKLKLARFALKLAVSGGSYGVKVGVEAAMAARKGVVTGAKDEYMSARQVGVDMAANVWKGGDPFSQHVNAVPTSAYNAAPVYNPNAPQDGW